MIIQLSPQVRENNKIWYEIKDNKITATINDITDTFDFTDMPDGELQFRDENENSLIETTLSENPLMEVKRIDGVLYVRVLFTIKPDEQDQRLLFPEPMTLEEFNDLMEEIAERDKVEEEIITEEEVDDVQDWGEF